MNQIQNIRNLSLSIFGSIFIIGSILAQDIQTSQVQFEKGKTGTTIKSSITGSKTIDYVLNVKEGQTMNVSMSTDNNANYFNIMEPKEDYVAIYNGAVNESTNMYEGILKKSGNYKIRVYLMRSAARRNEKANFRLEINVNN
ncbi:hypothetical protein MQE36_15850 [Zhouia spongiae]|uniref:DNA breaking-rejoining protein n=1 Tax=Zhouia spongiae TaxID=2202721 RepID=A0ABY3YL90_9FLAO|nr:hypothetical protein [Zhouia spongiae]UNY98540.1 hypothetical protein MQE36_15850 [Zhouia spongiae]